MATANVVIRDSQQKTTTNNEQHSGKVFKVRYQIFFIALIQSVCYVNCVCNIVLVKELYFITQLLTQFSCSCCLSCTYEKVFLDL